jgi:hypothetical protein
MATRNVTSTSAPWRPQQPYLKRLLRETGQAAGQEDTLAQVAPLPQDSWRGMQMVRQTATGPRPGVENAQGYANAFLTGQHAPGGYGLGQTASGAYVGDNPYLDNRAGGYGLEQTARGELLGSNPYFQDAMGAALDPVQSRVNAQFAGSGRYGSGMHSGTLADSLGDVSSRMSFQQYENERQRQQAARNALLNRDMQYQQLGTQAYENQRARQQRASEALMGRDMRYRDDLRQMATLAPELANQDYQDAQMLLDIGNIQRNQRQAVLDQPYTELQRYGNLISGNYGGTRTTPQSFNETGQTIGNIAGGLGALSQGVSLVSDLAGEFGDGGLFDFASGSSTSTPLWDYEGVLGGLGF